MLPLVATKNGVTPWVPLSSDGFLQLTEITTVMLQPVQQRGGDPWNPKGLDRGKSSERFAASIDGQ